MDHHELDVCPEPPEKKPMFINEPWLIDKYLYDYGPRKRRVGNHQCILHNSPIYSGLWLSNTKHVGSLAAL